MDLVKLIQEYINQGELIKYKNPKYWNESYDEIIAELKEIADITRINGNDSINLFNNLPISKFKTFGDYIKSVDIKASKAHFNIHHKVEKKKLICRHCGSNRIYLSKEGIYVCKNCNCEIQNKMNTQLLAKETVDNSKHIVKQLNTLVGKVNTPLNLNKILPYLKKWFLNRSYIKDFLTYTDRLDNWIIKYNKISEIPLEEDYFEQKIKSEPESLTSYQIFKLYTDTFYEMTHLIKNYIAFTNNMSMLDENLILDICRDYFKHNQKVPKENEIYTYQGNKYEIGKYIISMLITDPHSETTFKQDLNAIFQTELKLPGLMFDFKKIYSSENIPKKFTYQQNYVFIIHYVYQIPYCNILESDKQIICDIMMSFNNYVKDIKAKQSGKNHNSCLWQISLLYVFELPWFRCYKDVVKILPVKMNNTSSNIGELWVKFKITHYEELSKYLNSLRKTITETVVKTKTIKVENINGQKVLDFINQVGNSYGGDNDKYLRTKHNIQEAKHDWVNDINMVFYDKKNSTKNKKHDVDSNNNSEDEFENNSNNNSEDEFENNSNNNSEDEYNENSDENSNDISEDEFENDLNEDSDDNFSDNSEDYYDDY